MAPPSLPARPDDSGRLGDPAGDPAGGSSAAQGPWRQPVVWLGVVILLASLAGCALMIVLAMRHPDQPPPADAGYIMKMPLTRLPADPRP